MKLLMAIVIGVLFGSGFSLMVRRDVFQLAVGTLLLNNAAILFLVAVGKGGSQPPFVSSEGAIGDPLVQALALTAAVISCAVTVLLLRLALGVGATHGSIDTSALGRREKVEAERTETTQTDPDAAGERP